MQIPLTYMDDPSFLVREHKQCLFPDFTKVSLPETGREENRAPPCTPQHCAVMLRDCSMVLTRANSPAGLWSDKICKKIKLLTLYKAWLETRIALRCECPAVGLLTCQVHPSQSLPIHNSKKNKEQQREAFCFWAWTWLFSISIDFTISKKCTTVKFQSLFRNKNKNCKVQTSV